MNEFAWSTDDSEGYKGGESLDCQIGITENGQYEIRNHNDPSQSQRFDTPEELGEALANVLKDKSRALS